MKMKFLLPILLIYHYSNGQQKFIEVTVVDTILVKADLFVYSFTIGPDHENNYEAVRNYEAYQAKLEKKRKNTKRIFDSLTLDLKKRGFVFLVRPLKDSLRIIVPEEEKPVTVIILHSSDSLLQLYQLVKKQKNLIGSVEVATSGNESKYQNQLYKKMLDIANSKAKNLAANSNQRVSGIISITENKPEEETTTGWTSYPPLSALMDSAPGWHTILRSDKSVMITDPAYMNFYPIRASFTVRFSLE